MASGVGFDPLKVRNARRINWRPTPWPARVISLTPLVMLFGALDSVSEWNADRFGMTMPPLTDGMVNTVDSTTTDGLNVTEAVPVVVKRLATGFQSMATSRSVLWVWAKTAPSRVTGS